MICCYGQVDLVVKRGKIVSFENKVNHLEPISMEQTMIRTKDKVDELKGDTIAIIRQSLLGVSINATIRIV